MCVSRIHRVPPVWHVLAWIGSLGLGLTAFFSFASRLHFEYYSFKDIVATSAFVLYPESQDLWLYLLGLTVIPVFTLLGRGIWVGHIMLAQKIQGQDGQSDVAFITLTYLLWWVLPLTYSYSHRPGVVSVYAIGGLFVLGNGVFIAQRWLQRRALSHPTDAPPTLGLQGAISLLGAIIGISLLTSPIETPFLKMPVQTVLGMAIGLWGVWLGGTHLLNRTLRRDWRNTAECIAVGCLPLSILPVQSILWWEVYQGGQQIARYGFSKVAILLFPATVMVVVVAMFWALYSLVNKSRNIAWGTLFGRWFWLLTVPLLLYALAYSPNIHRPLDLFHEGERVTPAHAIMAGGIPYRDIVFVHGFLRDPGVALAAFRLFAPSVAGLRMLEQLLSPLVLVVTYYLASVCLGNKWALLYSLLVFTGFWHTFYEWRIVPSIITLTCLVLYIYKRRLIWAVGGGLFTFLALLVSFDVGIVTLVACMALSVALSFGEWRKIKLMLILAYLIPLSLGIACVVIYFTSAGALDWLWSWHWQILTVYRDWNGMPFPVSPGELGQAWWSLFSPLVSVAAMITLTLSFIKKRWSAQSWVVLLLLVANLALFNRGLVSGYVYGSALKAGSHFAPFLLLALFFPSHSSIVHKRPAEIFASVVLSLVLLFPTPNSLTGRNLLQVINWQPEKVRVDIPADWVQPNIERVGPLFLPPHQASSLTEITGFLSSAESFWDFTDHGALYFLSNHLSPTRFYATHHVITRENQQEVIASLTKSPPRYVLFRSGTGWDAIAGIDRTLRSFLVSEYLLKNYHLVEQKIGGFTVLEEGTRISFSQSLAFRVDLGYVPFLWGRDRVHDLETLYPASVTRWSFSPMSDMDGWQPAHDIALSKVSEKGWYILTEGSDAQLQNFDLILDPRSVTYLALQMRAKGTTEGKIKAQLFWRSGNEAFAEEHSLLFNVVPDGQDHVYLLRLASFPGWAWCDTITGLRFDPVDTSNVKVTINAIELFQVDELR